MARRQRAVRMPRELVADSLALVNRAIAGYRVAGPTRRSRKSAPRTLSVRIGYGDGEEVAAWGWADAVKLPGPSSQGAGPGPRASASERVAAILAGRDDPDPGERHAACPHRFRGGPQRDAAPSSAAALGGCRRGAAPDFAADLRTEIAAALPMPGGPPRSSGVLGHGRARDALATPSTSSRGSRTAAAGRRWTDSAGLRALECSQHRLRARRRRRPRA